MLSLAQFTLSAIALLSVLPRRSFARSLVFDDYTSRHTIPHATDSISDTQHTQHVARDDPPSSPKVVAAHVIMGNTYPYTVNDWMQDIQLASSKGIDSFALNLGADDWQIARVADAFTAADQYNRERQESQQSFKLFLSFDMAVMPCSNAEDASLLRKYINAFGGLLSYLTYHDFPLVSTYAGEKCTFGQDSLNDAWNYAFKNGDTRRITFVPFFNMDPIGLGDLSAIDGIFNWNAGWPQGDKDLDWYSDDLHIKDLGGRIYMAAVSPWFSTHYPANSFNKNWIYRPDNWLFAERWEMLAGHRDHVDIVQIISWNDFGESHYVGPIEGAQPMSESWTTGFPHTGFLDMIKYYAPAFTAGRDVSNSIDADRVFVWGRLSPAGATTDDPVPKPDGAENTEDAVWGIVLLTDPALVTFSCGDSKSTTVPLDAGANKMKLDLRDASDCALRVVINKSGQNTMDWSPEGYVWNTHPNTYNFNCFVAVS
ncbi:glycoside hydrolase family 71 protein [Hymenopellis radicata]|nr:glycoside hydrolase family 71 protein [Hymenopellis radicata]